MILTIRKPPILSVRKLWCKPSPRLIPRLFASPAISSITVTTLTTGRFGTTETSIWRDKKIPVYPALGNHDLHGDEKIALGNYFQRFPDLKNSRYYSVRAANTLTLVLDSSQDEASGDRKASGWPANWTTFPVGCRLRLPYVPPSTLHQFLGRQDVRRRALCPAP